MCHSRWLEICMSFTFTNSCSLVQSQNVIWSFDNDNDILTYLSRDFDINLFLDLLIYLACGLWANGTIQGRALHPGKNAPPLRLGRIKETGQEHRDQLHRPPRLSGCVREGESINESPPFFSLGHPSFIQQQDLSTKRKFKLKPLFFQFLLFFRHFFFLSICLPVSPFGSLHSLCFSCSTFFFVLFIHIFAIYFIGRRAENNNNKISIRRTCDFNKQRLATSQHTLSSESPMR